MVDTDVLIWVLRGEKSAVDRLAATASEARLVCSALTVSELLRMVRSHELRKTEALLAGLEVIPVTDQDARGAAQLMRARGPGFVDCHIAAAALRIGAAVLTYNRQDFERTGVSLVDGQEAP